MCNLQESGLTNSHHECVYYCVVQVRGAGMKVGVAVKPQTPAELLLPYLQQGLLDMVRH